MAIEQIVAVFVRRCDGFGEWRASVISKLAELRGLQIRYLQSAVFDVGKFAHVELRPLTGLTVHDARGKAKVTLSGEEDAGWEDTEGMYTL